MDHTTCLADTIPHVQHVKLQPKTGVFDAFRCDDVAPTGATAIQTAPQRRPVSTLGDHAARQGGAVDRTTAPPHVGRNFWPDRGASRLSAKIFTYHKPLILLPKMPLRRPQANFFAEFQHFDLAWRSECCISGLNGGRHPAARTRPNADRR